MVKPISIDEKDKNSKATGCGDSEHLSSPNHYLPLPRVICICGRDLNGKHLKQKHGKSSTLRIWKRLSQLIARNK